MKKRIAALLLAVLCMTALLMPAAWAHEEEESVELTRISWVQQLVNAFGMTVNEDNYPDNYYADISSDATYYRDLMVAVEFGVIDLAAGAEFMPEAAATREFAAHTLAYCMGFQPESSGEYSFADSADTAYPDDAQVAVNRGWFALVDGAFLPDQAVTAAEAEIMLADVAARMEFLEVSDNYSSTYEFAADIVVLPEGTVVSALEDTLLSITNCPDTIVPGCVFVAYFNGIPVPYIAGEVQSSGNITLVQVTLAEDETVFEGIDAQGTVAADLRDAEALDDADLYYYVEAVDQEFTTYEEALSVAQAAEGQSVAEPMLSGSTPLNNGVSLSLKSTLKFGDAVSLELSGKVKNAVVSYKISLVEGVAYVKLAYDLDVTYKVRGDFIPASCISDINDVKLLYWGIPGVGGFTITYDVELSGSFSGVQSWHKELGMGISRDDGFYLIRKFETKSFSLVAEAELQLGFQAKFGVTDLPVFNAYAYAKLGCVGKLKITSYDDDTAPERCMHFAGYLYANCGLQGSAKLGDYKKSASLNYDIYNEKNSPIRVSKHYEDGKLVAGCTRNSGADWFNDCVSGGGGSMGGRGGYYTPGSSGYAGSGWSGGGSSTGYDNGTPVVIYTYTTDDDGNATITGYNGTATSLVIPQTIDGYTVTAIGASTFKGKTSLRAVILPDTVTEVNHSAFKDCKNLSSVTLSSNLSTLEHNAFCNCTSLTSIKIPKSLTTATHGYDGGWGGPFAGCTNLRDVELEAGMTRIPDNLFYDCNGFTKIIIPDTVTSIGYSAFENSGLKSISIPDTVTEVNHSAFKNCTNLSGVTLSSNLSTLEYHAFGNCTSLTSIKIPKSLRTATYGYDSSWGGPFVGCTNLRDVKLETGMTRIPSNLFYNCNGFTEITIPDTVTSIGNNAFEDSGLKSISIPDTVTVIDYSAFKDSANLSSATLSSNLSTLEHLAFGNCTSLTSIKIPKSLRTATYGYDSSWGGPFVGCTNLRDVKLETGMTRIPSNLFYNCNGFTEITIPDTVTEIGDSAFRGTALETLILPDTVTKIEESAFAYSSLTEITIPDTVTGMGDSVFKGCSSLASITLPDSVTTINSDAFLGCSSLAEVNWSKSLTTINSCAFKNCAALTDISLPEGVVTLGNQAFYNCDALVSVSVPDSVTSFGTYMFYDCDVLTAVKLGTGITTLPASTFEHCDVLETLTVPRRVTDIKGNVFKDSVKFNTIYIPQSVTAIDTTAFSYPAKLTIYGVPGSYAETFATENSITFKTWQVSAETAALNKTELRLNKGVSEQLTLTVTPEEFTDTVSWKSADTSVATVSDTGVVKAVGIGSTTIKVVVGKVSASCKVTVVQPVTSVTLNKTSLTMEATETYQLKATIRPTNAEDQRVQWSSSAPEIASVSESGLVTALKKGTATITVTTLDGSNLSKSCTITVSNTAYICTTPEQMESPHDYASGCRDIWLYTLPGAEELAVTFDNRTCMEDGFDFLYVYAADGTLVGKYTGTQLAGVTLTIPGNSVKIQMESDDSGSEWGFKVTAITAKMRDPAEFTLTKSSDSEVTVTLSNTTGEPITACFVAAIYNADGRLIGVKTVTGVLSPDGTITLDLSGISGEQIATVKGFVLDTETQQPLLAMWKKQL